MKKLAHVSLSVGLLAAVGTAAAEQVRQALPACVSKEYLSAITDGNSLTQLMMAGKCTVLKVGASVVLIDRGFLTSTILYNGKTLVTPSEAIR
ncbi:hypothetical protein [Hydrogenophaga atypica]|uniref:Uncharacterized protein n=1 Tax=Hydrogenophaga atypica TaxID=249409 RepID=A0ABW2QQI7_9BURK